MVLNYASCDNLPMVLTPKHVGLILGISKNNAYAVVHSEGFPAFKVGKQYRVMQKHFFEWLDKQAMANAV